MNIQFTPVVKQLLIINVLVFFLSFFVKESYYYLAEFYIENPNFKFWQPITHMFMHGGYMHLFFNMFALVSFGNIIEHFWGGKRFLYFYIMCGLGASIFHQAIDYTKIHYLLTSSQEQMAIFDNYSVGASGAIYGLLVAFAFMFPESEMMMIFIPVPIKAKYFVPILVAMDVFSGTTGFAIFSPSNTGFFAHVGGALTGFILMQIWKNKKFNHTRWN